MVDERDFRILAHLLRDPFASYEKLGRQTGLSGTAAKTRLEDLERLGVLEGFRGLPAAGILHRYARLFLFKPTDNPKSLERALETESAVFATLDQDKVVGVLTYNLAQQGKPEAALVELLGEPEFETTPLIPNLNNTVNMASISELKVIKGLVPHPRISLSDLSESTGLSLKVVRKIRSRLIGEGMLHVLPMFQAAHSRGLLLYEILAHAANNSILTQMSENLPQCSILGHHENPPGLSLYCWANSLKEVLEVESGLKENSSIDSVRIVIHMQRAFASSRVIDLVEKEILRQKNGRNSREHLEFGDRIYSTR